MNAESRWLRLSGEEGVKGKEECEGIGKTVSVGLVGAMASNAGWQNK